MNEHMTDHYMEPEQSLSEMNDAQQPQEPQEGLTFKWINLLLGVAICFWWFDGKSGLTGNLSFYLCLCIVVVIHELGHVIFGKYFGCSIKEMQVFFLPFVSYKPKQQEGNSWRNITWSLGVLPLGGATVFKSRKTVGGDTVWK